MTIYAAFDGGGTCLYVGETGQAHPALRWAEHVRSGAPWVMSAVRWEVLADLTERTACERLQPVHTNPLRTHRSVLGQLTEEDRELLEARLIE